MDFMIVLKALMMGLVEGFTEFLPISSTGHLIVFGNLVGFHSNHKVFEIAIQLGAVLAVVFEYRQRFAGVLHGLGKDKKSQPIRPQSCRRFYAGSRDGVIVQQTNQRVSV